MVKLRLNNISEMQECTALWQWAQTVPVVRDHLYKITNEGKRSIQYGRKLKDIGLRPGIPDYHLPVPSGPYHGLWIEMKIRGKTLRSVPEIQKEWINKLSELGHKAVFAFGWEDAAKHIMEYINQ